MRKRNDLSAVIGLTAIQVLQIALVFGKFIPSSYGWFLNWAEISKQRNLYTDFFYPFPPGSLWLHGILPTTFNNPVIAEQIISSIIWILSVVTIFFTLRIWFSVTIAFSATLITSISYFTQPYNVIAGYFESGALLLLSGLAITIYAVRSTSGKWIRNAAFVSSGALLASSGLIKQTFWFPAGIALIGFCYLAFRGHIKENIAFTPKQFLLLTVGFFAPLLFVGLSLSNRGALEVFFSQVFSGSAKDPSLDFLVDWSIGDLISSGSLAASIVVLGSSLIFLRYKSNDNNSDRKHLYATLFLYLGLVALIEPRVFLGQRLNLFELGVITIYILFVSLAYYYVWLQRIGYRKQFQKKYDIVVLFFLVTLSSLFGLKIASGPSEALRAPAGGFLLTLGGVTVVVAILFLTLTHQRIYNSWIVDGNQQLTIIWFWVIASHIFIGSLSGGLSLEQMWPASAFALALIAQSLLQTSRNLIVIVSPAIVLCCLSMISFQMYNPYTWWGINEPSIAKLTGKQPDSVDYLRSTKIVSKESRKYYSRIQQMVNSNTWNDTELVTSSKSRTLAGPNNAGEIEIFGLNSYELNCPVLWWDVCPEDYLTKDVNQIVSDPPEIILWNMPPEWVQVGHERAFRNGEKSNMRVLNRWIAAQSVGARYELLGKLNLPDEKKSDWNTWVLIQRSDFEPSRILQETSFRP